jgi:hypothetical protein
MPAQSLSGFFVGKTAPPPEAHFLSLFFFVCSRDLPPKIPTTHEKKAQGQSWLAGQWESLRVRVSEKCRHVRQKYRQRGFYNSGRLATENSCEFSLHFLGGGPKKTWGDRAPAEGWLGAFFSYWVFKEGTGRGYGGWPWGFVASFKNKVSCHDH